MCLECGPLSAQQSSLLVDNLASLGSTRDPVRLEAKIASLKEFVHREHGALAQAQLSLMELWLEEEVCSTSHVAHPSETSSRNGPRPTK